MFATQSGLPGSQQLPRGVGTVTSAKGSSAKLMMEVGGDRERLTVGRFVAIDVAGRSLVGAVTELTAERSGDFGHHDLLAVASVALVGEIARDDAEPRFSRGVTAYPTIGDVATIVSAADLRLIHCASGRRTIDIGSLARDASVRACVNVDEMVSRHFAVLGSTGVGKSSGVAVLLNEVLRARPDLRVFMLDGHNEYGHCFGDDAHVLGMRNLRLPFWMLNFEETVDVIYAGRPAIAEEVEILAELIPHAKTRYGQYKAAGERSSLKRDDRRGDGITVDTPVPYLIQDLVALIDERMGRLDNRSMRLHYHRLMLRIETIRNDSRYAFLFENANVGGDIMGEIIAQLFQLGADGKPVTVMQLGGLPAEVIDAVVCVLARTAFEFGLWSEGAVPLLFVCEEAHRYASADPVAGFHPTRRALARIAKEGRKYGVYLGLVSQRPAELDPTIISQCSTLFVMRMSNERDQALLRSAIPDAAANLLDFVPSLATREVIGFGEGMPLPARITFKELPPSRVPRTDMAGQHARGAGEAGFVEAVVERWRGAAVSPKASIAEGQRREPAQPSAIESAVGEPDQAVAPRHAVDQIRRRLLRGALDGEQIQDTESAPAHVARHSR